MYCVVLGLFPIFDSVAYRVELCLKTDESAAVNCPSLENKLPVFAVFVGHFAVNIHIAFTGI